MSWYEAMFYFQLNTQLKEAQTHQRKQEASMKEVNSELKNLKGKHSKLEQDFQDKVRQTYLYLYLYIFMVRGHFAEYCVFYSGHLLLFIPLI